MKFCFNGALCEDILSIKDSVTLTRTKLVLEMRPNVELGCLPLSRNSKIRIPFETQLPVILTEVCSCSSDSF
jgi:hypothetical protein